MGLASMSKVRWGVLSTAKIGTEKVIPAMQQCAYGEVVAIASRDKQRAEDAAKNLGIGIVHDSYDALLADPNVDAIYNPLPNHLHVPWSIKAIEANKHVLCEKPIALNVAEAITLQKAAAAKPELKVMEAFMYRFHPQWLRVKELLGTGYIGELRTIQTFFSYFNNDPDNIRNDASIGGGGLMDIGCYPISQSRFLFACEPTRIVANLGIDPTFQTDREASVMMDFGGRTASFTCSTQMQAYQRTHVVGTSGRIEVEIPVNTDPDLPAKLILAQGNQITEERMPVCDQYTAQADALALAILENKEVPTPLDDAIKNMRVIEASVQSHESGGWVAV